MSLSSIEQETIISFNEEEQTLNLYTASTRVEKHLDKEQLQPYRTFNDETGKPIAWEYTLPRQSIRLKHIKKLLYLGGRKTVQN